MKYFLLFFFTYLILFDATAQKSKTSSAYIFKYVDFFSRHIEILDSIMMGGGLDNLGLGLNSFEYMERVTHIKAYGEGNWVGLFPLTWQDLGLWKTWYKNIGSKRIGIIN